MRESTAETADSNECSSGVLLSRVAKGALSAALSLALVFGLPGVATAANPVESEVQAEEVQAAPAADASELLIDTETVDPHESEESVAEDSEPAPEPGSTTPEEDSEGAEEEAAQTDLPDENADADADAEDLTRGNDDTELSEDLDDSDAAQVDDPDAEETASDAADEPSNDSESTQGEGLTHSVVPNAVAKSCQANESERSDRHGGNDSTNYADPLKLGTTACGVISGTYDEDMYAFDVAVLGNYRLDFAFPKLGGVAGQGAYKVLLLNSSGKPVRSWDLDAAAYGGAWIGKQVTQLGKGRWYVEVRANSELVYGKQYKVKLAKVSTKVAETAPTGSATRAESEQWNQHGSNDSTNYADPVNVGVTVRGGISGTYDEDMYAFDVAVLGNYRLDFAFPKLGGVAGQGAYKVLLLNSSGKPVRSWDLDAAAYGGAWIGKQVTQLGKGRWYVEVRANSELVYGKQYKVKLAKVSTKVAETAPTGSATRAESEQWNQHGSNDSTNYADPVNVGVTVRGGISGTYDEDMYAFDVAVLGNYRLDFAFPKLGGVAGQGAYKVLLLNSSGKPVRSWDLDAAAYGGAWIGKQVTQLGKGRWYVEVRANSELVYGKQYKVKLAKVSTKVAETAPTGSATRAESEQWNQHGSNDSTNYADPVNVGVTVRGGISGTYDEDIYAFDVTRAGTYRVDFSFDNIGSVPFPEGYKVLLLNQSGKSVRALDVKTTQWKGVRTFQGKLTKGRWYVEVQGLNQQIYQNLYRVKLSLVKADPLKLTSATPKISGTAQVGKTLTAKPGTWKPSGVTFKYQWLRGGKAISGATKSTYKLVTADNGKKISVKVTGSRSGYSTASKTSATVTAKSAALPKAKRVSGPNRYETAIEVSKAAYPKAKGGTVIIATGLNYPDSLSASPLAAKWKAPILLTGPTAVPGNVLAELRRLQPKRVVIVGGEGVVTKAVANTLAKLPSKPKVTRLGGKDRYETSSLIAKAGWSTASSAFIATGENFPDALSAGAAAGARGVPLILVPGSRSAVPATISSRLKTLKTKTLYVVTTGSSVSGSMQKAVKGNRTVKLYKGADRYATAAKVASAFNTKGGSVYIASGLDFPDGLTGAAVAGAQKAPLLLAKTNCIPAGGVSAERAIGPSKVFVLGGEGVMSSAILSHKTC